MAIGVPAALPHPRAQQQSPVPFSPFAPSATFNQTYNGLSRGSVGMPNQAAGAGVQVSIYLLLTKVSMLFSTVERNSLFPFSIVPDI